MRTVPHYTLVAMAGRRSLRRIAGLLFLMLVLCGGGGPATAGYGSPEAAGSSWEDPGGPQGRTAAAASYDALDGLTGTPNVPFQRSQVLWFVHAFDPADGALSGPSRQPSAHDPPKTLLYCTLLI